MQIRQKLYDFFTANIQRENYFELRKEIIVRVFLSIAAFILIAFGALNFFVYHKYNLALIDAFASIVSIYSLFQLQHKKTLQLAIKISSLNLFFFFLAYLYLNQNNDNGLVWLIFLPLFIIPLNGHKKGLIISLVFYAIAFSIAYFGIGVWDDGLWNFHSYIRFVLSSLVLVYMVYITELAIYRTNIFLEEKEKANKLYMEQLKDNAQKDYLTNVFNRRRVHELLVSELQTSKRYNIPFCVAIVDIDFFKHINDKYGHNIGDEVLVNFSQIFTKLLRETDIFGRWGGEEFVIVFTHTHLHNAAHKCEQLREMVEKFEFDNVEKITCSIGLAECTQQIPSVEVLVENADKALYKAKESGRNKVVTYKQD